MSNNRFTDLVKVIVFLALPFSFSPFAFASAAVARQQQMRGGAENAQAEAYQQAQQQAQVQAYQQALAERQAQEMQAYQQQVIMQQVVQEKINQEIQAYVQAQQIQAAQQAMIKQIVEQELLAQMAQSQAQQVQEQMIYQTVARAVQQAGMQQAATVQAYQKAAVIERIQVDTALAQQAVVQQEMYNRQQIVASKAMMEAAEGQKMNALRNQAGLENAAAQKQYEAAIANQLGQEVMAGLEKPYEQVSSSDVKSVVPIADVWKNLDENSRAWALMIDNQAKVLTVKEYIERYRKQGAKISQPPIYYVKTIDEMVTQNPIMLQKPFIELLQFAAIVDYDFDAEVDRDALAKKLLGSGPAYQANKKRLGR